VHSIANPLPFREGKGKSLECVLKQHNIGHTASRLAATFHGDAKICLFERKHIIYTVTNHRHIVMAVA
jgi:hypothetical protein